MTFIQFLRILNKNTNLLLLSSLALAIIVFFLTRNLPKTYETRTEIFTGLASGQSIDGLGANRVDYFTTSNEFDNLISVIRSEQTLSEVGEKLLAQHLLLDGPEPEFITKEAYEKFEARVPQELRDSITVPNNMAATMANIRELKQKHFRNWTVQQLFESQSSPYSYLAIGGISVRRITNSDLVEVTYTWTDPGICQQTLLILNDVFTAKLLEIKVRQSSNVVEYFKEQVEVAQNDLTKREEALKNFRIDNKIINYNQQTENIAVLQGRLEQEYQQELRAFAAAKAAVAQLEKKLELNKKMIEFSDDMLDKKRKLAKLQAKIAELEIYYNDEETLAQLRSQAEELKAEASNRLSNRYQYSKTKEGVKTNDVLQEYLSASLQLDESKARLDVLSRRTEYFQSQYNEMSPLGSELNRLERAADVAEDRYKELLHSLNVAMTKQKSEALSTGGLVVTVPPKYPLNPKQSKQLLFVFAAAVIGFIVPLLFILIFEFLDGSIKTPLKGEEVTGLKLLGAYPNMTPTSDNKKINMNWLSNRSISHVVQNLRLATRRKEQAGESARKVIFFSMMDSEGTTSMVHKVANELMTLDKTVLVVTNGIHEFIEEPKYKYVEYEYDLAFQKSTDITQLLPEGVHPEDFDFLLLDLKGILSNEYPIEMVEKFDSAVCVVSAKRKWSKADKFALWEFEQSINLKPRLLVNAVEPDFMDSVLGEIPKLRSGLRRFIKSILTVQPRDKKLKAQI